MPVYSSGRSSEGLNVNAPGRVVMPPRVQDMPSKSGDSMRTPRPAASLSSVSRRGTRAPRFQQADLGAVKPRVKAELFLAEVGLSADPAQVRAEAAGDIERVAHQSISKRQ